MKKHKKSSNSDVSSQTDTGTHMQQLYLPLWSGTIPEEYHQALIDHLQLHVVSAIDEAPNVIKQLKGRASSADQTFKLGGVKASMSGKRARPFAHNATCCKCGLTSDIAILGNRISEGSQQECVNLYAVVNDKLVLMTVDHYLPRAFFGNDTPENLVVMCQPCNSDKQHTLSDELLKDLNHTVNALTREISTPKVRKFFILLGFAVQQIPPTTRSNGIAGTHLSNFRAKIKGNTNPAEILAILRQLRKTLTNLDARSKPKFPTAAFDSAVASLTKQIAPEKSIPWYRRLVGSIVAYFEG